MNFKKKSVSGVNDNSSLTWLQSELADEDHRCLGFYLQCLSKDDSILSVDTSVRSHRLARMYIRERA